MTRCDRTTRIVDRLVDEQRLDAADAAHLLECEACSAGARHARAFDQELRRAARALATEPLPIGIAQTVALPRSRNTGALLAGSTVVVVLLVALGLATVLRGLPPSTGGLLTPAPGPALRSEALITAGLTSAGYECHEDIVDPMAAPPTKGLICKPEPSEVLAAAIVLHRDTAGDAAWLVAKTTPMDKTDAAFVADATAVLELALREAVEDPSAVEPAQTWLDSAISLTQKGGSRAINVAGLHLRLERARDGGYMLSVGAAR